MSWIIAMKGGPGSGKSTVATELSRYLGWPLIDKDDIRPFLRGEGDEPGEESYEVMLQLGVRQVEQGLNVILDSPLHRITYERARERAAEVGASLIVLECYCGNEDEWRERVEGRKDEDLPEHRTTSFAEARAFYDDPEKWLYDIRDPHRAFDTCGPIEELLPRILDWLATQGVPVSKGRDAAPGGNPPEGTVAV